MSLEQETSENSVEINNDVISAYLMSDGEIVEFSDIQKASKTRNNSNAMDTDIDDFGESYASGRVYRPPLNLKNLKVFSSENPYHQTCISQIANDCCSSWNIKTVDKYGLEVKNESNKRDKKDLILYNFFNNCTVENDFIELCQQFIINYSTYGFSLFELTRTKSLEPKKLYLASPETFRVARDLSNYIDTDMKYMVQVVNAHERIFKIFGKDSYKLTFEPHTGNVMSEILYLRNYHVDGGKYGIPPWFPALKALLGYDKVAEYNIRFFDNEAVPRFAVIVQGGKLDDGTKTRIKDYFKKDLKGIKNSNKTLVLSSPKGVEIKLVPLGEQNKDGSFRFYRKDNRDEVLASHRMPPHRVPVLDSGNSGTLSPGTVFQLDKNYKYSVISPLQRKLESILNNIIIYGFGFTDKRIEFKELDIGEEKVRAETLKTMAGAHEKYYAIGAMNINHIKQDLKIDTYVKGQCDEDIYEWATTPRPVYLIRQAQREMSEGLNGNTVSGNINETTNDFSDKSREQTQGNTQFSDDQLNELMMKRQATLKVLKMLDNELNESIKRSNLEIGVDPNDSGT